MQRLLTTCDQCNKPVLEETGGSLGGIVIWWKKFSDTERLDDKEYKHHFCSWKCLSEWANK